MLTNAGELITVFSIKTHRVPPGRQDYGSSIITIFLQGCLQVSLYLFLHLKSLLCKLNNYEFHFFKRVMAVMPHVN